MTEAIAAITKTFAGLGGLLFLFLVISQFLAHFNYSNLATIAAVRLSDIIESANLGSLPLLIVFVVITAVVNLIIPAAIAKWAILAPIFVPLFMKLNVAPGVVSGCLSSWRLARKRDHAIDGLFWHDRHIRPEVSEGRRRRNGRGDDVTLYRRAVCRVDGIRSSFGI